MRIWTLRRLHGPFYLLTKRKQEGDRFSGTSVSTTLMLEEPVKKERAKLRQLVDVLNQMENA